MSVKRKTSRKQKNAAYLADLKKQIESYNVDTTTNNIIIMKDDKYITKHVTNDVIPLQSTTKAISSLAIGFLIKDKSIKSVKTRLCDIFTDNKELHIAPKNRITVEHILTHTSGLPGAVDWVNGGRDKFVGADDLCEYCLGRKLVNKPGAKYDYSNIGLQIVACIVTRLTGRQLNDYMLQHLFKPLGITKYIWNSVGSYTDAKGGLSMRVVDLYKIAQCIMNNGRYNGRQIISREWIAAISVPLAKTDDDFSMQGLGWHVDVRHGYIHHGGDYGQYMVIDRRRHAIFVRLYRPTATELKRIWNLDNDMSEYEQNRLRASKYWSLFDAVLAVKKLKK
jgi:CubicO group peptidase (beta-lactamase class C family)